MRQESQALEIAPLCECGCGTPVERIRKKWNRFVSPHHLLKAPPVPEVCPFCGPGCLVGYGTCHCGCGEKLSPLKRAARTTSGVRLATGWYRQYVTNHHNKDRRILTDDQARTVRARFLAGETHRALAAEYGTSVSVIAGIVGLKTYKSAGFDLDA